MIVPPTVPDSVRVYTDGACQGNPGPGGWGWAIDGGPSANGCEAASTNQRMEVWAVLDALTTLLHLPGVAIRIVSDSTYVVNCFRDQWYKGWMARGWKNSQKQPVANQDLWKPLVSLYLDHHDRISFEWVKGHSGNMMNDRVDALAVAAAASQSGRALNDPGQWFQTQDATPADNIGVTEPETTQETLF
jgi:ribonuclease HI